MEKTWMDAALRGAVEGGSAIMRIYNTSFDVTLKDDNSPLTLADEEADKIIAAHLAPTGIPILSEEGAKIDYAERSSWSRCWIVDPLDGTKEFIKHNGEFTVNIALVENGVPVFGVVYAPALGKLYCGEKGKGAFRADVAPDTDPWKGDAMPLRLLPSTFTIVGSRSHASPETEAYVEEKRKEYGEVDFVAAGSSLKFCLVAEGKAHAYPRFAPTMEWDTAAGQAVLEAAGGTVVTWPEKQPLRYNREQLRNPWFLATAQGKV